MSLEPVLKDIQRALDAGAFYAALSATLSLPEICGRCEQQDVFSTKGQNRGEAIYKRFVETYLQDWELRLTGEDLHNLRCGLSHRGQMTQRGSPFRYVFYPPDGRGNEFHNNLTLKNGQPYRLMIDLQTFCYDIAQAVRRWFDANKGNELIQRNLKSILQVREGDFGTGLYAGERVFLG